MTRIAYIDRKFSPGSLDLIAKAEAIMDEYSAQGFSLTLRQLYYQFVARGFIPNSLQSYKRLGSVVNDARLAGLLDWDNIEDRTRNLTGVPHWRDPGDAIADAARSYAIDLWEGQPIRPEIWVEKEALSGVVEPTAVRNRVDYFACRGYTSQSELWRAANRFIRRWKRDRQRTVIFHLGDHDPSGIDMTRDNLDRLCLFVRHHTGSSRAIDLKRLALNMDQVEQYNPPPNPAKLTDSRCAGYMEEFGDQSWELDALDPTTIDALLQEHVNEILDGEGDRDEYEARQEREVQERDLMDTASARWDEVAEYLREGD